MGVLVRLEPEQVAVHWALIKNAVLASLPPWTFVKQSKEEIAASIYHAMLRRQMDVWFYPNGVIPPKHVLVTCEIYDPYTETKSLCVYANYSVPAFVQGEKEQSPLITMGEWVRGLKELERYGRGLECQQVIAYMEDERLRELMKRLGFEEQYCFTKVL
ncbi:MAG TPA: hypothetical protein VLH56_08565 [Dissulfurispiraceae bacterium]|nr:hypothetical protein [Dissulfurispiraceae bacterium]